MGAHVTSSFTISYWEADTSQPIVELTAGDLLRAAAAEVPDRLALVEAAPAGAPSLSGAERTDRTWTYAELLREAERCARFLLSRFRTGERITVWAPNIPEWVILEYGAALAGIVLVTANPALRAAELAYVVRQSRSAGIFYAAAFRGTDMAAIVDALASEATELRERICFATWDTIVRAYREDGPSLPTVRAGDAAQIQYTSGTTGAPKGALLHHRGLVTNATFFMERLGFPHGGCWVSAMPLFHTSGSGMSVLGSAATRATYVLCQSFDPELVLKCLHDWRGACLIGVPTMLIAIAEHPRLADYDLSACTLINSGGSTVPSELVRRLEARLDARFTIVFGQTEASPVITQTRPDDSLEDKANTIGRPLPQVDVKIVDPSSGEVVPVGMQGELCARGYQMMIEYFDMPEATAAALDADGWLHTGDLATMDERGYFAITGRLKDMIIRGGENIYPREIEDVLFTHPQIADVTVVGVPDDVWGERVVAVIRLADPANAPAAEELQEYCRARLAPHKTPRAWYHTREFPLTGSGKIQKFKIVELLRAGAYAPL
jgi:acyl-CoA synthetase (AMP-forming)/AMP-acid ligase II